MLQEMTDDGWKPVIHAVGLNSDERAVLRQMLDEKIEEGVSQRLPIYKQLKSKLDALPF